MYIFLLSQEASLSLNIVFFPSGHCERVVLENTDVNVRGFTLHLLQHKYDFSIWKALRQRSCLKGNRTLVVEVYILGFLAQGFSIFLGSHASNRVQTKQVA